MRAKPVVLQGRSISGGIAVGRAEVRLEDPSVVPVYRIQDDQEVDAEIEAFHRALKEADGEAEADLEWARGNLPESEAEIFAAQRAILSDPTLVQWVEEKIRVDRVNAGAAVRHRFDEFRAILEESSSEIIRNRVIDVTDAERVILARLLRKPMRSWESDEVEDGEGAAVVLVTNNPPPSLLARVNPDRVVGIVCERGAGMGHVAVLARALDLPALIQVEGLLAETREGDMIALNADAGIVTVNPAPEELEESLVRERQRRILLPARPIDPRSERVTVDGQRIRLQGNVNSQRDVAASAEVDADGVGLYRTEFLYLQRDQPPSEADLVSVYSAAACSFEHDPVDIRLLDLGSDKSFAGVRVPAEKNPALGLRSLRFLFQHTDILRTQVRAILQAAADGPVRILLPMVADPQDIRRIRSMVQECHENLRREGVRHDPDVPLGAMIEHPAGVVLAREIFLEADFISVGTNDLIMYVLAVDRNAAHVASYYDPLHPAIIRILKNLVQVSLETDKRLSICGEIAGDPTLTGLLVGLGVTALSMIPQWIVPVGHVLAAIESAEWREVAEEAVQMSSAEEVRRCVRALQKTS